MTPSPADRRAVACNYVEATSIAAEGAKAYVISPNPGWASERIAILVRSRSGRLVLKWEAMKRLTNFRAVTIPPEHPRYSDERMMWWDDIDGLASRLEAAKVRCG